MISVTQFQKTIYEYYRVHRRRFPWRTTRDPYRIVVSEIMLQQTQADRVIPKYKEFITAFPNITALATAPLHHILTVWQGLGYNRRAKYLKELAQVVRRDYNGTLPETAAELKRLPGIGPYTAHAVCAFAFNQPVTCIETNIRTVFIHFFFQKHKKISDSDILPLIEKTVDIKHPREWYNALMDYGDMLKKTLQNPSRKSAQYTKQKPFHGSRRQLRGLLLKTITNSTACTEKKLLMTIDRNSSEIRNVLEQLQREGFIKKTKNAFSIA